MSPFEFFFSFYGLLLGLSVAQVANGVGHALATRRHSRLGWLTPALAAFVLLDIASFWLNAWEYQKTITVSAFPIYFGMIIALSYYIATVLLFPTEDSGWEDLDRHYWSIKRWVVAGIAFANFASTAWLVGRHILTWPLPSIVMMMATYWIPLALLGFSTRKWLDGVCLALLIAAYVFAPMLLSIFLT